MTVKTEPRTLDGSAEVLSLSPASELFRDHLQLVPQLNELYELQLAFYESRILSDEELIRNGAYFAQVGKHPTRHFLMCQGEPVRLAEHSSLRLKQFFRSNQFKTGYATHGLFPYRGKFHPQMIKGLINVMGLKPGETVLDPMMGSGTVLIEAALMGIKSVGVDASPFCRFMTQAKLDGLTLPLPPVQEAAERSRELFAYFSEVMPVPQEGVQSAEAGRNIDLFAREAAAPPPAFVRAPVDLSKPQVRNFLLLAYLDAAGYALRSKRATPEEKFAGILERYYFVASKIQRVLDGAEDTLAEARSLHGDARDLDLDDGSVDGVIFSPPYSFAIDYLANDAFHLTVLNEDVNELREGMVGLRGSNRREQYQLYLEDMNRVLAECARVLRPGRFCTVVVGTNNNQLAKILQVAPEEVRSIPDLLMELGQSHGLNLVQRMERQITGMANTMRTEFILFLQRS